LFGSCGQIIHLISYPLPITRLGLEGSKAKRHVLSLGTNGADVYVDGTIAKASIVTHPVPLQPRNPAITSGFLNWCSDDLSVANGSYTSYANDSGAGVFRLLAPITGTNISSLRLVGVHTAAVYLRYTDTAPVFRLPVRVSSKKRAAGTTETRLVDEKYQFVAPPPMTAGDMESITAAVKAPAATKVSDFDPPVTATAAASASAGTGDESSDAEMYVHSHDTRQRQKKRQKQNPPPSSSAAATAAGPTQRKSVDSMSSDDTKDSDEEEFTIDDVGAKAVSATFVPVQYLQRAKSALAVRMNSCLYGSIEDGGLRMTCILLFRSFIHDRRRLRPRARNHSYRV
jgi:hypothetical protein